MTDPRRYPAWERGQSRRPCNLRDVDAVSSWLLVEYLKVEYLLANLLGLGFTGAVNFGLKAARIWRQAASQRPVEAPPD